MVRSQSDNDKPVSTGCDVTLEPTPDGGFDWDVDTLIVGAGACGLVAALAAHEAGQEALVLEADTLPRGSTALSAGLIPAAGSSLQAAAGIADSPDRFAADIQAKAHAQNNPAMVQTLAESSAPVLEWLMKRHGLPFSLVDDFDYPGHSRRRLHGLPTRSGVELIDALRSACERQEIAIACSRRVSVLHHEGRRMTGVSTHTGGRDAESVGCRKLVLACNGFGGNPGMVARYMPGISGGLWFGHDENRGDAVLWGEKLGASLKHLGAYQGHGNVAHPHGILISWAVITLGGFQVNQEGDRFWDESQGYSEAARAVLAQPGGVAITVFDERIAAIARQFEDFKQAEATGAVRRANTLDELAEQFSLPLERLSATLKTLPAAGSDVYGRRFSNEPLQAPYYGVRVTGALFHTQGGLEVDTFARVLHSDGSVFPNLYAGGGAACGVSGAADAGYLSGNGLLSAVILGYRAGRHSSW